MSNPGYSCTCDQGYFGNGTTCVEGDCTEAICSINEECISPRTSSCRCKNGFERSETEICVDINECNNQTTCDKNADCINLGKG